jgi:hypothetical protein
MPLATASPIKAARQPAKALRNSISPAGLCVTPPSTQATTDATPKQN